MAGQVLRISYPLRIGRPRRVKRTGRIGIIISVDFRRFAARHLYRPKIPVVVLEQQLSAIRRPRRRRKERCRRQWDRAWRSETKRIADHQLILTTRIRKPRELTTISRPRGTAIVGPRTLRQVSVI